MRRVIDNRYTIVESLGGGGVGEVFLARDGILGREVALKMLGLRYAGDEEFVERFKREARSTALLSHPNIVSVHDLGEFDEGTSGQGSSGRTLYITMEYVRGITLADFIREDGPLSPKTAVEISLQTARGLAEAHGHGIIHRDIKPANILLAGRADESPEEPTTRPLVVKVTDFGISRSVTEDTLTEKNAVMGTSLYLSPEQALGRPAEPRSDLYSLGVVLYEMLTGRRPFEAAEEDSPLSVAMKHVMENPLPPEEINPEIPPAVNGLILSLLAKEPEERPENAPALVRELEEMIGEMPGSPSKSIKIGEYSVKGYSYGSDTARIEKTRKQSSVHPPEVKPGGERRRVSVYAALAAGLLVLVLALTVAGALGYVPVREMVESIFSEPSGSAGEAPSNAENPAAGGSTKTADSTSSQTSETRPNISVEENIRQAVRDYYEAVDRESWTYTYEHLDASSQKLFTRNEWYRKNQWFADRDKLELDNINVDVAGVSPSRSFAEVNVYRTFESGFEIDRNTVFVNEDGTWKHRLVGNELIFFMPDASFEEFVEAQ